MPDQAVPGDGQAGNEPVSDPPRIREAPVPTTTVRSGPLPTGNIETPIHAPVPLIYGRSAVKAQVFGRSESNWSINNQEQVWFGLCLGPIDSVEWWYDGSTELRASDFDTGNRGGYTGAPTVDAGALSKTPFPGTVLGTMAKNDNGYNRFPLNPGAMVKGRTVYDPRLDTAPGAHPTTSTYIAWSENPALCMADLKTSARYGSAVPPADIDWPSVVAAAEYCEEQVDGLTRYTLNICLGASRTVSDWEKTIGLHFGACWQFMGTRWSLIVYKAATASPISIVPGDIVGSPKLTRNSSGLQAPNRITVEWADLWGQSHQVSVQTTAVDAGAAVIDPGTYALHGCTTRVQALRCAQAILDQALYDMTLDVELMPAMLDLSIGDLIELNDPSVAPLGTRFQIVSAGRTDTDTVQVRAQEYVGPPGSESAPFTPGDLTIYAGPPDTTGIYETEEKYNPVTDIRTVITRYLFTMEYQFSSADEEANAVAIRFRAGDYGGAEDFSALPAATEVRVPIRGNTPIEHSGYYKLWIPFLLGHQQSTFLPAIAPTTGYYEIISGYTVGGRIVMVVEGKDGSISTGQVVYSSGMNAWSSGTAPAPGDATFASVTVGSVKLTPGRLFNIRTGR